MKIEIVMIVNDRTKTNDKVILATSVEDLARTLKMPYLYKEVGDDDKFLEGIKPADGNIIRYRASFPVFKFVSNGYYINLLDYVKSVEATCVEADDSRTGNGKV